MNAWRHIEVTLRRWRMRLRLTDSLTLASWGLATGLALGIVVAMLARTRPLIRTPDLVNLASLLTLVAAGAGISAAWIRPRPFRHLTRLLDGRLGLAERLTTALELHTGQLRTTPALMAAQLDDTVNAASKVDLGAGIPVRVPRLATLLAAGLAIVLIILLRIPNPQDTLLAQQAALQAAIDEQIEALEDLRDDLAAAEGLTPEELEALLQSLEETISALEQGQPTAEEAMAALAEAERELARLQEPEVSALRTGLDQAAEELADSSLTQALAQLLEQGEYAAAAEALASLVDPENTPLTRAEQLELAEQLAEAAEALAESSPELAEQLASAAAAIDQGEIGEAQENILQAAEQLAQAGEQIEGQESLEDLLAALQEGRAQIAEEGGVQTQQGSQPASGQASTPGQQTTPGHSEDAGTGTPYDKVYVPNRLDGEGEAVDLTRDGDEGPPVDSGQVPIPEGATGSIPYSQVYADYAAQAHAALEGSYIPLGMKGYVRDYFSSLEPQR